MTMGDRIKPARGRDTGEINGAPTVAVNDPEEAGGSSAHDHTADRRLDDGSVPVNVEGSSAHDHTADRRPWRLTEDAALTDAPGS